MGERELRQMLLERGELRHEQCRFGTFAQEAYRSVVLGDGNAEPFAMPLCSFKPPGPVPPLLLRRWGGDIEFDRDCAVCDAYAPLTQDGPSND